MAAAVSRMRRAARGSLELTRSPVTGRVSFVRAEGEGIPVDAPGTDAVAHATACLREHGSAFGLEAGALGRR